MEKYTMRRQYCKNVNSVKLIMRCNIILIQTPVILHFTGDVLQMGLSRKLTEPEVSMQGICLGVLVDSEKMGGRRSRAGQGEKLVCRAVPKKVSPVAMGSPGTSLNPQLYQVGTRWLAFIVHSSPPVSQSSNACYFWKEASSKMWQFSSAQGSQLRAIFWQPSQKLEE